MADPKPEEAFRVVDRRLFTPEGELRKDVDTAAFQESPPPELKPPVSAQTAPGAPTSPAPEPAAPEPELSRGFQMLVDFLARNAAAMLGGMTDPRTGQAFLDIEGAREVIDMLDALREKTRGNLAKADDDLLMEVIGSLKLTFMEVSKVAAETMAKRAKGRA